jgi:hypothetical protein
MTLPRHDVAAYVLETHLVSFMRFRKRETKASQDSRRQAGKAIDRWHKERRVPQQT